MAKGESEVVLEQFFRALADRTRLRLLNLMGDEEVCVCFFVQVLGVSQPKISRHLAYLRRVGVVASRREGKCIIASSSRRARRRRASLARCARGCGKSARCSATASGSSSCAVRPDSPCNCKARRDHRV